MSPSMLDNVRRTFRTALNYAVALGIIARNPCSLLQLPRVDPAEITVLTPAQLVTLMAGLRESLERLVDSPNPLAFREVGRVYPWAGLLMVTASMGLRQTEAIGLTWDDLQPDGTVKLWRRLGRVYGPESEDRRRHWSWQPLKTHQSRRRKHVPDSILEILELHRALQARLQTEFGLASPWIQEEHLMFTSTNGTPLHQRNIGEHFSRVLSELKLPKVRFHDLRHSYATLLSETQEPIVEIQEALRHGSIQVTQRYLHSTDGGKQRIKQVVEDALFGAGKEETSTNRGQSGVSQPRTMIQSR